MLGIGDLLDIQSGLRRRVELNNIALFGQETSEAFAA